MTRRKPRFEPRWPAAVAVLVALRSTSRCPTHLGLGPPCVRFVVPALELALLIPLAVTAPHRHVYESGRRRKAAIALTAIVTRREHAALFFLIHYLVTGARACTGGSCCSAARRSGGRT